MSNLKLGYTYKRQGGIIRSVVKATPPKARVYTTRDIIQYLLAVIGL
jgi:hypothetical protein